MKKLILTLVLCGLIFLSFAQKNLKSQAVGLLKQQILAEATWAMQQQPITITAESSPLSTGGKHDFFSQADYFWPNPTNPTGPYINRDGETNPNNFIAHRKAMIRLSTVIGALASAYQLTGDEKYVKQALKHLNAWFVNQETLMNPNLSFAQAVIGSSTGRSWGIIDTIHLMEVAQGILVMQKAKSFDKASLSTVKKWFADYTLWLNSSKNGVTEKLSKNNHSACWVMQVASFAKLCGDESMLDSLRWRYQNVLLPNQMAIDGSFPLELARTKAYGYSIFNLDAMTMIAQILSTAEDNLWGYETPDGKSIAKGINYLYPFVADKAKWPLKPDVMFWENWPVAQPFLLFGALAYQNKDWFNTWRKLDLKPTNEEVIRNLPIRHPLIWISTPAFNQQKWESKQVKLQTNGRLQYIPDAEGNVIPDFSSVGYHQNKKAIPNVKVVATIFSTGENDQQRIQNVIDSLAKLPADANGSRGAILLKKGVYKIPGSLKIAQSGIVLRGEGEETKLIATGKGQRKTIVASGIGQAVELPNSRTKISDSYVPVGAKSFKVNAITGFKVGDAIMVFRPGTAAWIKDLKMDQIAPGNGTVQWTAEDYNFEFERIITKIQGNTIFLDNPIVMAMEEKYGGGAIYKFSFEGRIREVGIENLMLESEYASEVDEDHGWDAISYNRISDSWIKGVTGKYFGYSCVNLGNESKQITVYDCKSLAPKSQIIGGRRYSFNNDGQLNLFIKCFASEGRHDFVTGAKVRGPNVFFNCTAEKAKADIGPHHRWAMGTLYDNVHTDGEINVQDRGNWGTGHGWSGVNQFLWNCIAAKSSVQNPYVSGKNYAIGLKTLKYEGRLTGRPDGVWEGQNKTNLSPSSLYLKQVEESKLN